MKRSRRKTSRWFIPTLAFIVAFSGIYVIHKGLPGRSAAVLTLSALDTENGPSAAQTRPSVQAAVIAEADAPIQTTTPTPTDAPTPAPAPPPALLAAAPTTLPSAAIAASSWSQLLSTGPNAGDAPANLPAPKTGPIVTGNGPLADGQARVAAGELLDARAVLNDALQSGKLAVADAAAAKAQISQINQTLIFSTRPYASDPFVLAYSVRQGDSLAKIAAANGTTWELLSRINQLEPRKLRYGKTIKVIRGPFFAVVTKQSFLMDVYLGGLPGQAGSMYVMSFPVGLGKDNSTPTGLWSIAWGAKLRHPTYYPPEGGDSIQADDPKNPLGGYWIGLTGVDGQAVGRTSYGIHGTIDPDSIGHQASMGCIRLRNDDIALVFELLVEGKSKVLVKP